ncbi:MAG: SDR family oxidoreductase [Pseudohongiella sp.]|uniref:SDR family NAD(P)-dependent oxidoreductase n=1 Tax=Pseudohongiella sp. TaxID=1979412 RepID=UPI0034A0902C
MADTGMYCVITGAAGGIGRVLVKAFTEAGYGVIGLDRISLPDGIDCRYWIKHDLAALVNDETRATEVVGQVSEIVGEAGLHVLINNAAVQVLGGVQSLSRANWQQTLDVNLTAPFFLAQGLFSLLERARGSVINIGSIHAQLTKKNFVAYATSKAALAGLTRVMAVDIGNKIRVNGIEPAAIDTDMLRIGFAANPDKFDSLRMFHPASSIGRPEDVARAALFLSCGDSKFINGCIINVDGGIRGVLHDPD